MTALPDIIKSMNHPGLLGKWFNGASWNPWRAVIKAQYGLPMSDDDISFLRQVANRAPPTKRCREGWWIVSRRGGKDSVVSGLAAHAAASFDPTGFLRPGERAVVACIACDREQGKIVWRYIHSFFQRIPPLARMVDRVAESDGIIELSNQVDIVVLTGSHRALRGRPILLAILDEVAFYRDENSSTPDTELYNAILPGLATIPQSMLIGISSPYKRSGLLFERWRKHFGQDNDDILVIQAPSHVMNPTLDTSLRDRQLAEDPAAAASEWMAEWRDDLVAFVDPAAVDRAVVAGRTQLPPVSGINYVAAVDPSGGSSDSMTLAIAHAEGERGALDLVAEWRPPFSPEAVTREIADICKRYDVSTVTGDRYGGEWPRERFRVHGIEYQLAEMSRSDAYLTLLPALNTPGKIELLDNRRLVSQLCGLERRTARSGKDSVDHPRGAHDDIINAAALALVAAALAPRSSADNWIEFYKRQCIAAGINPDIDMASTDTDAIRAPGPAFGWDFAKPEQWISLKVPTVIADEGRPLSVNGNVRGLRRVGHDAFVEVRGHDEARELLRNPVWRALNEPVAKVILEETA